MISKNTFDIELNQPPINGSCSIDPWNGTMISSFIINWKKISIEFCLGPIEQLREYNRTRSRMYSISH